MSHDPYAPASKVGPHRVFVDPPPDPGSEVPGHPDEVLAWLREPGDDGLERARRVDLAEEIEMARPGRMRPVVLDAIRWNRAVIVEELDDGDESWAAFEKTADPPPAEPVVEGTLTDEQAAEVNAAVGAADPEPVVVDEATIGPDGTVVDEATIGPVPGIAGTSDEAPADSSVADSTEGDASDEVADPGPYTVADVPINAADVVAWIQAAPDESDAARRSQAAWLVEIDRTEVRKTVKAEIDKHLA